MNTNNQTIAEYAAQAKDTMEWIQHDVNKDGMDKYKRKRLAELERDINVEAYSSKMLLIESLTEPFPK